MWHDDNFVVTICGSLRLQRIASEFFLQNFQLAWWDEKQTGMRFQVPTDFWNSASNN